MDSFYLRLKPKLCSALPNFLTLGLRSESNPVITHSYTSSNATYCIFDIH